MFRPWYTAQMAVEEQKRHRIISLLNQDVLNRTILQAFDSRVSESVKVNKNWVFLTRDSVIGRDLADTEDGYWGEILRLLGYEIQENAEGYVVSWGKKPNIGAQCQSCKHLSVYVATNERGPEYRCNVKRVNIEEPFDTIICSDFEAKGDPLPEVHHRVG